MLVDTGSGYSVINQDTLDRLMAQGQATYVSRLRGKMADGSERIVPLYQISAITLGNTCVIRDIKAAVIPNSARQIIGISTLMQAAPFSMAFDPPVLSLSQCELALPNPQTVAAISVPDSHPAAAPAPAQ